MTAQSTGGSVVEAAALPRPDRRGLMTAIAMCVIGAGVAIFAVTRTWSTTVTRRPAPLPAVDTPHSGSSQLGWVIALALVGLAGAGALLATRGGVRVLIGVLIGIVGIIVFGGGVDGLHLAEGGRMVWPILVMIGGLMTTMAGYRTMRQAPSWPAMGAKYERPDVGGAPRNKPVTEATMWDDLDRGVDPTDRD